MSLDEDTPVKQSQDAPERPAAPQTGPSTPGAVSGPENGAERANPTEGDQSCPS